MKVGVATDVVYWHEKLVEVTRKIKVETGGGRKTCTKVFVTFEKEVSQRECLKAMTTGDGWALPVRPGTAGEEGGGGTPILVYLYIYVYAAYPLVD